MAAQHLRCASRQMKLASADIDPHVGVRHHQIGIAGQPEAGDVKQRRQPLVGDGDVDMLEMDRVAEILCGAVELLHDDSPTFVGWEKRSVPTIHSTDQEGGHAALCPPYKFT